MRKQGQSKQSDRRIFTITNHLSLFRRCLIPLSVWLYVGEHRSIAAGCLMLLSGVTDTVDGLIARRFHMTSDFGRILGPVAET